MMNLVVVKNYLTRALVVVTLVAASYLAGGVVAPFLGSGDAEAVPTDCEHNLCQKIEDTENCPMTPNGKYLCGVCYTYEVFDLPNERTNCSMVHDDGVETCKEDKCPPPDTDE